MTMTPACWENSSFFLFQNFDNFNATPAIKELWDVLTDANKQVIQISKMYSKLYQIKYQIKRFIFVCMFDLFLNEWMNNHLKKKN